MAGLEGGSEVVAARTGFFFEGPFGLVLKTLLAVAVLIALKFTVHRIDWEPVSAIELLTGLMGGVVFTLAILLAGTLADYKESERLVGELASQLRQIHWDFGFLSAEAAKAGRTHLRELLAQVNQGLLRGTAFPTSAIHGRFELLTQIITGAAATGAATAQVRTLQVWVANALRIVDRFQVIIETTFLRAGYYLAGTVVVIALAALTVSKIEPFGQGLFLYAFASFLLVGVFLLIWDLDNPFAGHARISNKQLSELERELAG